MAQLMLFSGNATPELSQKFPIICPSAGNASIGRFSDGEIAVEIVESAGEDVFRLAVDMRTDK